MINLEAIVLFSLFFTIKGNAVVIKARGIIPNGEVNLDGDALVQEGMEKQMALKDELTADLEKVNNVELMRGDAEMAAALQDQMSYAPFPTPFLMMS